MPENIEWPPANVGQLIELERRLDEKWEVRLTQALDRLSVTMEREVTRMGQTMGIELGHAVEKMSLELKSVVETREDRRTSARWLVGVLLTVITILVALNVFQYQGSP